MPIYEYMTSSERHCAHCRDGFEVLQRMNDPQLTACPHCGAPARQRISAPHVVAGQGQRLDEGHLGKHGFTQYRRAGGGVYEKTAGKGPAYISGDE